MASSAVQATAPKPPWANGEQYTEEGLAEYHRQYVAWREALVDPRGYGWGKPWVRRFGSLSEIDQQIEAEKLGFESLEEMALDMGKAVAELQEMGWGDAVEPAILESFEAKLEGLRRKGRSVRVVSEPHRAWHAYKYSRKWVYATYNAAGQVVTPAHWLKYSAEPEYGPWVRATVELDGKKKWLWYDDRTYQVDEQRKRLAGTKRRVTYKQLQGMADAGNKPVVEGYTYSWTHKPGWRISTPH